MMILARGLALALLLVGLQGTARAALCFKPLFDYADRNPKSYADLAERPVPDRANKVVKGNGVVDFLPIAKGRGKANIDFYYITFSKPQGTTLAALFQDIRLSFSSFASGKDGKFAFGPYEASDKADDPVKKANAELWAEKNPFGVVMSFNLDSISPFAGRFDASGRAGTVAFHEKAGDVQAVCASDTDFIFATVKTKVGGTHPVSGFRGFGLKEDAGGTWTFYSKAVDRESGFMINLPTHIWEDDVFCKGHLFWIGFFAEVRAYLKALKLDVKDPVMSNHGPVTYPFTDTVEAAGTCGDEAKTKAADSP